MKIAGQKNDGAWFRLNKALKELRDDPTRTEQIYELSSLLAAGENINAAFAAIQALMAETGVTPPESPATASAWITRLVEVGIPRQVWNGRLSFTTYTRSGTMGDWTYTANHQAAMHLFAKDLRKTCKVWLHGRRAVNDLVGIGALGQGNPGGQADATEGN